MPAQIIGFPVERMTMHVRRRLSGAGPQSIEALRRLDGLHDLIDGLRRDEDRAFEGPIRPDMAAIEQRLVDAVAAAVGVT